MFKNFLLRGDEDLFAVMTLLDQGPDPAYRNILFVVDSLGHLKGHITTREFRRFIVESGALKTTAAQIMHTPDLYVCEEDGHNQELLQKIFQNCTVNKIAVIDEKNRVVDVVHRHSLPTVPYHREALSTPVVVMAGGKGTRMAPFTKILPKPLIPVGEKTITEHIIEEFRQFQVKKFFMTVNHMASMIKTYFDHRDYPIEFLDELVPHGTAGSLTLLKNKITGPIFISNCDTLIKENYAEILSFHQEQKSDITIVGCVTNHRIEYGVCRLQQSANLDCIEEKPSYEIIINTGMYLIDHKMCDIIPDNTFYNFTDFIVDAKKLGKKVCVFPITEKSWIDIGRWPEYRKVVNFFEQQVVTSLSNYADDTHV